MQLEMFRIQTVTVTRDETRNSPNCRDFDRYVLKIATQTWDGHEVPVEVHLYTEPDKDIGLGPLVDEDAYDSGYLDAVDMAINAARDAMERGDNPADVLTAIRATYKERGQ